LKFRKEVRKRNRQFITIGKLGFEKLSTALTLPDVFNVMIKIFNPP
jgi:hypothetical protein